MTNEELKTILEKHQHWWNEDCDGWEDMRADLRGANLIGADLIGADLRGADLIGADLRGADLRGAHLIGADLRGANLICADLIGADLIGADLRGADLIGADLRGADLRGAHLIGADLRGAHLIGADLIGADLIGADLRGAHLIGADLIGAKGIYTACPIEGEFIAWKKCRTHDKDNSECIVKLLIPADAKRSSATSEKCRADKAIVIEIQDLEGNKIEGSAYSIYSNAQLFEYKVGETVEPQEPFCENRWKECASGIHFFIDRNAAVEY